MAVIKNLNSSNFEAESAKGTVLVDFWADGCGPCRMLSGILEELAGELAENVLIAKVKVSENMDLARKFGVRSIPSIFVLKDGAQVKRMDGPQTKSALKKALEEL